MKFVILVLAGIGFLQLFPEAMRLIVAVAKINAATIAFLALVYCGAVVVEKICFRNTENS